jgi:uncharacterized protein DUF1799
MRALGASEQDIAAARAAMDAAPEPEPVPAFGVWEENWPTFEFFCSLVNQWAMVSVARTVDLPMGGSRTNTQIRRAGLPANRIESSARMRGIARSRWPQLFADIQLMEQAVLDTDAKRAAAAALRE